MCSAAFNYSAPCTTWFQHAVHSVQNDVRHRGRPLEGNKAQHVLGRVEHRGVACRRQGGRLVCAGWLVCAGRLGCGLSHCSASPERMTQHQRMHHCRHCKPTARQFPLSLPNQLPHLRCPQVHLPRCAGCDTPQSPCASACRSACSATAGSFGQLQQQQNGLHACPE